MKRVLKCVRSVGAAIGSVVSLRDLHFYGGLAIAAVGGAMLSAPITLIALGAALAAVGLFTGRRR